METDIQKIERHLEDLAALKCDMQKYDGEFKKSMDEHISIRYSKLIKKLAVIAVLTTSAAVVQAETNTVTSTVTGSNTVTVDKTPPTASAPNIMVNQNDMCKSGVAAAAQTSVIGLSAGITIDDKNCERLKLSRSLYQMGMKVAAVATLCGDPRVFDSMIQAGTPCPYKGKIGAEALTLWKVNLDHAPEDSIWASQQKKLEPEPEVKISSPTGNHASGFNIQR